MPKDVKFYGWNLIGVLWLVYLINASFPYYGAGVVNAVMTKALSLDRRTLGLGFTLILLFTGLPGPLVAVCINKKGIRFTLIVGSLFLILGALLMALVVTEGWQYVLVFGVIIGIGCSFGSGIAVMTGVTLWFTKKRALAMSIVLTAGGIGGFVAPPLLDRIIAAAGGDWKTAWLFVAGIVTLSVFLSIFFVKNRPSDLGQVPDGLISEDEVSVSDTHGKPSSRERVYRAIEDWKLKDAMKTVALWLVVLSAVIYTGHILMFIAHGVIHLKDIGHTPATAAMSLGLLTLCSIASRLLAGVLADRIEPRYIWAAAMLLSMGGILVVINATSLMQVYLYAILLGIGFGAAYVCNMTIISNYFGANSFASIMGIMAPITVIASSIAPFLAGLAYDKQGSYAMAFIIAALLSFTAAVILLFAKPPKPIGGNS